MFTLALTAALGAVMAMPTTNTYPDAYKIATEEGKPLVVLIGAEWCPACQTMKNSVMPTLAGNGALKDVAYAYVNTDRERGMANRLMSGSTIPQLVIYTKVADGWKRQQVTGGQSVASVEQLLIAASRQSVSTVSQRDTEAATE